MHAELNVFRTPLGWSAMLGRSDQLLALSFAHKNAESAVSRLANPLAVTAKKSRWNPALAQRIVAVLEGEPDEFRDVSVDLTHLTPFSRRVIHACRKIGWGGTASYRDLAAAAGSPGAARAVGQVMAGNRTPLVIPCHRVIASGGRLGGFSAPQGLAMKLKLLNLEAAAVYDCC